ncbi:VapA/VapB family virulence-associated protein [Lysinibacter sp. HNR]|uniref:VapA/VapB family virulence-associated protein n=1 Tax=Lysinibacter sp. HNR TaxID=3031408 RepID=UPI0024353778|nr:VapA/VapB family virulence-associated protein [Lysinibacter sp. HNR]WGD37440.1 VapA/VapB family virulence-associated protein [Lysinibacter sp. HNR]
MKHTIRKPLALLTGLGLALGAVLTAGPANATQLSSSPAKTIHAPSETVSSQKFKETYNVTGNVASAIFYLQLGVQVQDGSGVVFETLKGNAGGIFTPGGGALVTGTLSTNDSERLFAHTVSFQITAAAAGFSVLFFDSSSNLLGHLEAGGVSTVVGVGGGTASWSKQQP